MKKGESITCAHYSSVLDHLKNELHEKRQRFASKKVISHHDKAHFSVVMVTKLTKSRFQLVEHFPLGPALQYEKMTSE